MNKISLLTQLTYVIATTHASLMMGADFTYSEKERLFADVFVDAATNPSELNLSELKKAIIPQEVSATCIVKETAKIAQASVLEQNLSSKMDPALRLVAQECPYAFYIANKKQPSKQPSKYMLALLTAGFIYPFLHVEYNGEDKRVPIANAIIKNLETSCLSEAQAFGYMERLLTSGLNPFYEALFTDGQRRNLYQIVRDAKLTAENQNRFTSMFDATVATWPAEDKTDIQSMFRRGSPFNWTEKGKPF